MTDAQRTPGPRASDPDGLGAASGLLALPWGIFFFFAWAYAGSDAYLNIAVLVLGPVIATVAIFTRHLLFAASLYLIVAIAEVLRPFIDTNDSFLISFCIALIPLAMATACLYTCMHVFAPRPDD